MSKDSMVTIRFEKEDKEMLQKIAERSPQQDLNKWLVALINQELERLVVFDDVVRDIVNERLIKEVYKNRKKINDYYRKD